MFEPYGKRSAATFIIANRLSDTLDRWPRLYLAMLRYRLANARYRIVSANHILALEAFPRSGSSFSHRAFEMANPDTHRLVATHIHRSSQVLRAAQLGLPTVVLVREPRAAVTSLLALTEQEGQMKVKSPIATRLCIAATLRRYALFYERVTDTPGVLFAGFDEIVKDFGKVIGRINAQFGTTFAEFDHTKDNEAKLMKGARKHLGPNVDRDAIKARFVEAYDAPSLNGLRKRANAAYTAVIAQRDAQIEEGTSCPDHFASCI